MIRLFAGLLMILLSPLVAMAQSIPEIMLAATPVVENDAFGASVDVDGAYAAVGAFLDNNERGGKAGALYIFKRTDNTWT